MTSYTLEEEKGKNEKYDSQLNSRFDTYLLNL